MKFCVNMYLDNIWNSLEFQGHCSNVKVTTFFGVFLCECVYLRTVLSLEQGLIVVIVVITTNNIKVVK